MLCFELGSQALVTHTYSLLYDLDGNFAKKLSSLVYKEFRSYCSIITTNKKLNKLKIRDFSSPIRTLRLQSRSSSAFLREGPLEP